jgi:hypothetical protein
MLVVILVVAMQAVEIAEAVMAAVNNKLHYIYVLKDEKGSVFYVGKTVTPNKRFPRHLAHVRYGSHYPVHNKLRKVISIKGNADGIYQIIESNILEENIDNREIFFIKYYKEQGCKLKNLTEGGEGGKGYTDEINKRAALKRVGLVKSPETRRKISESKKGQKFSQSHKNALKKAWKTRPPFPSDWGERMSKLNKGKINIKKFVLLSPTNETIITENGLTDFCRQHELSSQNLHKTWKGERKHHKGWKIISRA